MFRHTAQYGTATILDTITYLRTHVKTRVFQGNQWSILLSSKSYAAERARSYQSLEAFFEFNKIKFVFCHRRSLAFCCRDGLGVQEVFGCLVFFALLIFFLSCIIPVWKTLNLAETSLRSYEVRQFDKKTSKNGTWCEVQRLNEGRERNLPVDSVNISPWYHSRSESEVSCKFITLSRMAVYFNSWHG